MTPQIHHVPGRLRVRLAAVKGSHDNAAMLQGLLQAVQGVYAAEPNVATGSIVVRYDPDSTSAGRILALLADRGYFAPAAPRAVAAQISKKVAEAVLWYVVEKAVERSLLMLAALL